MSPRIFFEQELEILKRNVAEMGERAELSYDRLVNAVEENDRETLKLLLDNDRQMIDMQRSIEGKCLLLLTKQQPVAKDLRLVSSALKVVTDIERVGDHVADIAELYLRMGESNQQGSYEKLLVSMMEEARRMLCEAVEAFVNGDEEIAGKVIAQDDVVDELFNQVKEQMMRAICNQDLDADRVVDYLMVAKYLEKIGDHAVNIGEWAIFLVTGDMQGVELY
ncbi:MAG: phosphate signaling complex protein PhoU [Lachnospiraceae bacterium]|nr:phosphate signaling complex protein PhoU [Lachnospiraceae bacterium]